MKGIKNTSEIEGWRQFRGSGMVLQIFPVEEVTSNLNNTKEENGN